MKKTKKRLTAGFTLLEVLFAAMLIGLVIAALAASSGAFTMANGYGVDLSTAEFLTEQVREYTLNPDNVAGFDALVALNNTTWSPPKDASGAALADFGAFTQKITVNYIQEGNLAQTSGSPTNFVRVTVTVTKSGKSLSETSWIRARLN
jgi:type II secretory pathway pseudopilin PulG